MAGGAHISLVGYLGKDPIKRVLSKDLACTSFPVACDNGYKGDTVMWLEAISFGAIAEVCAKHLRRGNMVYITGKLRRDEWVDKGTGILRSRDKVEVQCIYMLDKPRFADKNDPVGDAEEPELDFTQNPNPQNMGDDKPPAFNFDPTAARNS